MTKVLLEMVALLHGGDAGAGVDGGNFGVTKKVGDAYGCSNGGKNGDCVDEESDDIGGFNKTGDAGGGYDGFGGGCCYYGR